VVHKHNKGNASASNKLADKEVSNGYQQTVSHGYPNEQRNGPHPMQPQTQ